jgi:glyoxylase-like metal-dependent hydrolase (beta-lactamase superfamily II)
MNLIHVKGNTYYLEGKSAVPVYAQEDGSCVLIDSGWPMEKQKIFDALEENHLSLTAVLLTHMHIDHSGNCLALRERFGAEIVMPVEEAGLACSMENLRVMYSYLSRKEMRLSGIMPLSAIAADRLICPEDRRISIGSVEFSIIHTPGHSSGHVCIVTPDDVVCTGDAVMGKELLKKARIPRHQDPGEALDSLKKFEPDHRQAILAHGGLYPDLSRIAAYNGRIISESLEMIRNLIEEGMIEEDIAVRAEQELGLRSDRLLLAKLNHSLISRYLHTLTESGQVRAYVKDGKICYSRQLR